MKWEYGATVEHEVDGKPVRKAKRYTPAEMLAAFVGAEARVRATTEGPTANRLQQVAVQARQRARHGTRNRVAEGSSRSARGQAQQRRLQGRGVSQRPRHLGRDERGADG